MAGRRELKKQETREAIRAAALKLFSKNSFEKTSIEDIAREAGIGKTTIYGYFPAKDDIFIEFCDQELDQAFARLRTAEMQSRPLLDQLVDFFMTKFRFVTQNEEFGRQFLREMIFPQQVNEKSRLHDQRYLEALQQVFKVAQEKKLISEERDIFLLAVHFFSLYLGTLVGWYKGYINNLQEAEQGMRSLFGQTLEGIGR